MTPIRTLWLSLVLLVTACGGAADPSPTPVQDILLGIELPVPTFDHGPATTTDLQPDVGPTSFELGEVATVAGGAILDVHVPSEVAGATGLGVKVRTPDVPRYGTPAPVAIVVSGGWDGGNAEATALPFGDLGVTSVHFNFPGGGQGALRSGGTFDTRGPACRKALRDVVGYVMGTTKDLEGKTFAERIAPVTVASVGLVGLSNGGNLVVTALDLEAKALGDIAWAVLWESPLGDGMPTAEAGAKTLPNGEGNPLTNAAYNPDTGAWATERLRWGPAIAVSIDGVKVSGGFYFDNDGNKKPTVTGAGPTGDFVVQPLSFEGKGYPSIRVLQAAQQNGALPEPLPEHVPTLSAVEAFWKDRDGAQHLVGAAGGRPGRLWMLVASELDHVQSALDHPHVLGTYVGLRDAGATWVRLNPDAAYLPAGTAEPVDNEANRPLDHQTIRAALQPKTVKSSVSVPAAVAELSDRVLGGVLAVDLEAPIVVPAK